MSVAGKYQRKSSPWRLKVRERRTLLLTGDFIVGLISLGAALFVWGNRMRFIEFNLLFLQERVPAWFYFLPIIWMVLLVDIHDVNRAGNWGKTVRGIASVALICLGVYALFYFFYSEPRNMLPRVSVAAFLITVSILTLIWRWLYIRIFAAPQFMRRVLLVGGGRAGQSLLHMINDIWPPPFFIVGIIDDDPQKQNTQIEGFSVMGTSESLLRIVEECNVSDILVAITGEIQSGMFQTLLEAQEQGIEIIRLPRLYEELVGRVPIRLLEGDWILRTFVDEAYADRFYDLAKRLLDFIGGLIGTVILICLLPFIAIAILLDDGLPIFYYQKRMGRGGTYYNMIKLRTMLRDAEADGMPRWAKEADERATRVGRFLRKTHLDELPQFLNVLKGEMSLVGPRAERPELVEYFQHQVPFYRARLLIRPGITGWAQINFGYASSIEDTIIKLEYDLYYIIHRSIFLDVIIMLRTPATVFGFRGR